jgi:hypothetical protein
MEKMSRGQEEMVGANEETQPEYPPQATGPRHGDGGVQMIALDVTRIRFR